MGRLEQVWATEDVPADVDYARVLATRNATPLQSLLGVGLGIVTYLTFAPIVTQLLALGYWQASGAPGAFADTYRRLVGYEVPFGMSAVQLGISTLIPISLALVLFVHRVRPAYLLSVRPGMRWGLLGIMVGVAAVTLNGVLLVQHLASGGGLTVTPQRDLLWFMIACLLTSPIQAAAEELFFRGYLMQALGALVPNHWFGIVTSAAIFAFFHGVQNPWLFADRFAFGVLAGWLVVKTGGLEAGIGAHIVNNVCAFLYAGLSTGIAELKALQQIGWAQAVGDIAMFGVFALAAWLVARRLGVRTHTDAGRRPAGRSRNRSV